MWLRFPLKTTSKPNWVKLSAKPCWWAYFFKKLASTIGSKKIFISAIGSKKNVSYQLLDLRKKTIGSAQVGDQRKHLAVLLTLRTELDEKGQPTDNLHPEVKNY